MTDLTRTQREALEPLVTALLDAARADAAAVLADAEEEARRVEGEARERAAEIREEARARGAADGAERLAADRAAARRRARDVLLAAEQRAYDHVRAAAVAAVAEAVSTGEAGDRLRALVVDTLGPDATVTEAPGGGVVGEAADGRRVDASAARLVDLAMAALDVEGLWAP